MALNISNALKPFELADFTDLNCGTFDLRIRQAAVHNEEFRAAVAKRTMRARKNSIVPSKGSLTGDFNEDVELFCDLIVVGWGKRPLKDDDGNEVTYSREVAREMFTDTQEGRVLFGKVMQAAVDDESFVLSEEDKGNS